MVRDNRDATGRGKRIGEPPRPSETYPDDAVDALAFDTVILPARLESEVARKVAIASTRDGVSVADLLGRAAAAYDWGIDEEPGVRGVRRG